MALSTNYLLGDITFVRQKSRLLSQSVWIYLYRALRKHSYPFLQATVML